jgi:hypothetical protein
MAGESRPGKLCYFIRSDGPEPESVRKAFSWLLQSAKPRGFVAVHVYANLDGMIRETIGDAVVKALRTRGRIVVQGSEIVLLTEHKLVYNGQNSPLLAFYPNPKFLDELDSIPSISAMLVVPWNFSEVEPWIRARSASELGVPSVTPTGPSVQSRVVEQALKGLTLRVNLSTGISHPRDHAAAVQMFEILKRAGESFSPDEVKAWLIGKGGWKATHAQDVAEVAQKVLEGRRLRTAMPAWAPNILEIWRQDAEKMT